MNESQKAVDKMLGLARILEAWNARWAKPTVQIQDPSAGPPITNGMIDAAPQRVRNAPEDIGASVWNRSRKGHNADAPLPPPPAIGG